MAKSVDPDQTAPIGAVCYGSTLFASILNSSVMLGNYLQQTTLVWSGSILFTPILANTKNPFQVCAVDCHIGLDKDGLCTYNCIYFLSQRLKHKLWVFKVTVSLRRFF